MTPQPTQFRANRAGIGLGQDASIGPLPSVQIPSFSVDSNVILFGAGALAVIWLFGRAGSAVSRKVSTYSRKQEARARRRRALQEELRNL